MCWCGEGIRYGGRRENECVSVYVRERGRERETIMESNRKYHGASGLSVCECVHGECVCVCVCV